jgi:hypothetical protein
MLSPEKLAPRFGLQTLCRVLVCGLLLSPGFLLGQSAGAAAKSSSGEPEGINSGGYLVHSSAEIGYRSADVTGSTDMYNTLVNLQTGPRFLDETLSMHSIEHQGMLFDDLYLNSFGWGGDPNNALRLRAEKNKWYSLQGNFRHDQNFFNYNLLDNPLNPPTSTPTIQAENSPHLFDTVRRMSDIDLTLMPQSRVSVRLGFSHNNMTGPSYSSVHEGTDALLLQGWNTTSNSYRAGVDLRIMPRTVLSLDQFLDYYKGDTGTQLASFSPAFLSSGVPVELGLPFDTANNVPCAVKAPATSLIVNGVLTNNACNGYFSYSLQPRIRTFTPTGRLSLRSGYFSRLDLVGSFSYSAADMTTPLDENFNGLLSRTFTRAFTGSGTGSANRISNVGDFEATVHLTVHLRLIEKFSYWAFRIPQDGNFNEVDSVCIVHGTCSLLTPLSGTAPATTLTMTNSSFNQTWKRNQSELAWDITKKAGVRVGLRYGDQVFSDFKTFATGGEERFVVDEYTALFGFWARPIHALRFNFDLEHSNFDKVIFRMAPRKEERYRFQATYAARSWALLGGSINLLQDANADALTNYKGHNQNFGFTAALAPRERVGVDLAYNLNRFTQNALICFADTPPIGVTLGFVSGAGVCPDTAKPPLPDPLYNNAYYTNHTNFGMATVRFKPAKRVVANLGYSISSVAGSTPQLDYLQPLGTTQYKYQQPVASVSVDLGHRLAYNMGWNYDQYNEGSPTEGSFVGPTAPRYFHSNAMTESLRYAF